jgi:hypothetical protein
MIAEFEGSPFAAGVRQRLQRVFSRGPGPLFADVDDFQLSVAVEIDQVENGRLLFQRDAARECQSPVLHAADPDRFFARAEDNDVRLRIAIDVADPNLLGPHQTREHVPQIEPRFLVLQKDDHLRRFGIGDHDVDQSVTVQIAGRQVTIFAASLLAESVLDELSGKFSRLGFGFR